MCCNGSKASAPQLYAVASTWLSCVSLPIQRLFLGMCANLGLLIYGGDATDAYAHSPAPNDTYLTIDDAYANWYYNKYKSNWIVDTFFLFDMHFKDILKAESSGCK